MPRSSKSIENPMEILPEYLFRQPLAERRVDGSPTSRIIIHHPSINIAVPGGDPKALEHQFAAKNGFTFFCYPDRHLTGST